MSDHWTYSTIEDSFSDLEQGDFLLPTEELKKILREVHPHFCDDKYIGFVVTTQTCDLVRRSGSNKIKSNYINIASVRSLRETASHIYKSILSPLASGIFRQSDKGKARDFLHRLFNQNEQSLGMFYFHPDTSMELGDPSVAYLRVTVTLRSDHYDELVTARRGRLSPEFQAKLGWLVGNLYSRTATIDWSENNKSKLENLIKEQLKEQVAGVGPNWIADDLVEQGIKNNIDFEGKEFSFLMDELEQHRLPPPLNSVANEVEKIAEKALRITHPNEKTAKAYLETALESLLELIKDNSQTEEVLVPTLRQELEKMQNGLKDAYSINSEKLERLSKQIKQNSKIRKLLK